jgi:hypothetical protein
MDRHEIKVHGVLRSNIDRQTAFFARKQSKPRGREGFQFKLIFLTFHGLGLS